MKVKRQKRINPDYSDFKDLVALIIDENNPMFGKIAAIELTSKPIGDYFILRFADGTTERTEDLNDFFEFHGKLHTFYRFDDSKFSKDNRKVGPTALMVAYLEYGGKLTELMREYEMIFGEGLQTINPN